MYISGIPQKSLSCSEEFRELMDLPTSGARNLKHHLAKAKSSGRVSLHLLKCPHLRPCPLSELPQPVVCVLGIVGSLKPAFQSISASALLKQQKQHMLEMRKKKSEEIQKR
jgi:minichromosome maintenance protein 10